MLGGVVDFYGLRIRTCACMCACVCWVEPAPRLKDAGNRHFVLRCINFQWQQNGVSGRKEREESTVFLSVQGWGPHV